jgi:hypothetical protein
MKPFPVTLLRADGHRLLLAALLAVALSACRLFIADPDPAVPVPAVPVAPADPEVVADPGQAGVVVDEDVPAPDAPADVVPPLPPVDVALACRPELALIAPGLDTSPFLSDRHFVLDWHVLGPFRFEVGDFQGEQQQDAIGHPFMVGEAQLHPAVAAPEGVAWRRASFGEGRQVGMVDLNAFYGGIDYACAYAVIDLQADAEATGVSLRLGSDDYHQVWLNGELVHTYGRERRAGDWDQDVIDGLTLRPGCNRLVVKCIDIVGAWGFCLRFTDRNGMPFQVVPLP